MLTQTGASFHFYSIQEASSSYSILNEILLAMENEKLTFIGNKSYLYNEFSAYLY